MYSTNPLCMCKCAHTHTHTKMLTKILTGGTPKNFLIFPSSIFSKVIYLTMQAVPTFSSKSLTMSTSALGSSTTNPGVVGSP